MIGSIRSKPLRLFWEKGDTSKLPVAKHDRIRRQLAALNLASEPEQMNIPGWRFHALQGRPKRYAVDASGNYRVTFGFEGENAVAVDLEDYH